MLNSSLLLLTLLSLGSASTRSPKKNDAIDIATYAVFWPAGIASSAHDLGHALAAKALTGATIKKFDILQSGSACFNANANTLAKRIAINTAGPLSGILSLFLCKKITDKIEDPCIQALYEACINVVFVHQVLYGFTPLLDQGNGRSDGAQLWKMLGLPADDYMRFTKPSYIVFLAWAATHVASAIEKNIAKSKNKWLVGILGTTIILKISSMIYKRLA